MKIFKWFLGLLVLAGLVLGFILWTLPADVAYRKSTAIEPTAEQVLALTPAGERRRLLPDRPRNS